MEISVNPPLFLSHFFARGREQKGVLPVSYTHLVSYKSGKLNEELAAAQKAIHVLGGEAKEPVYFQLTGTEDERSFVCIEKRKATPKKYPRKAGTPAKEPIQ